jgi:hypothetical protein
VATISVVRGSEEVAFVGLYIVDPEYRGQGHGKALWEEALAGRDGLTLGLDGVPAQVEAYQRDGFTIAFGNLRFSANAESLPGPDPSIVVNAASSVPFDDLVDFDGTHFFGPRPEFLRHWIAGEGRRAAVTTGDHGITGFAALRPTRAGYRIGPIFAQCPELARALVLDLASGLEGPVMIDAPENPEATKLYETLGMELGFQTARMYRGQPPELPLDQIYGITTLELG